MLVRFLLGAYTADADGAATGIGVLRAGAADSPLAGGDLAFAGVAASAASPSWIAWHPTLDVLYAAQETAGTVQAFARTGEESFAPLGSPLDAGALVCHVAVAPDGGSLLAACWGDGRVVRFPLAADGRIGRPQIAAEASDPDAEPAEEGMHFPSIPGFEGFADLPLFGGQAPVTPEPVEMPARVSRAHQSLFLPGGVIATTDMGLDLVRFWTASAEGLREAQSVVLPRGSGPRHMAWHPSGHLYVVTELSHEVFVLAPEPDAPVARRWRVVGGSPLAAGTNPGSDFAAEIALTRDAQYAVVGIRGSNTIASLRVRDGGDALTPVALVESGVDWPRHHVVVRDSVLVAGQLSHEVVSLALDERTGVPGRVRRRVEVPSPTRLLGDRGR